MEAEASSNGGAPSDPIRVCVTGGAGQIAYSLLFSLARGEIFGPKQEIILHLLDIPPMMDVLGGVKMELDDCATQLLRDIVCTTDPDMAFRDVDVAILVGAFPRREGMERKDLLQANAKIFKIQGEALDRAAKKTVKVLVVGNPANTNALITSHFAPSIPKSQFTCLTMLDQNRAYAQIAQRVGCRPTQVKRVIIWGNHSATQYPDVSHAVIQNPDGSPVAVRDAINDAEWVQGEFIKTIQQRGGAVIKARKLSSAMSAAKAIGDHMRAWWTGTTGDEFISMGVVSDGSYGIRKGLIYSMPVIIKAGVISIVTGLEIDAFSRNKMDETHDELLKEREVALTLLGIPTE